MDDTTSRAGGTPEYRTAKRRVDIDDPILRTVLQIADLHAEHHQQTTPAQHTIDWLIAFFGRPAFVGALGLSLLAWMGFNLAASSFGFSPFDERPFPWLQTFSGTAALILAALILATQRRENELADHREQLTLELAILSDQKSAKIIELLEELRRDSPNVVDRVDDVADVFSKPADTKALSDAIKQVQAEFGKPGSSRDAPIAAARPPAESAPEMPAANP